MASSPVAPIPLLAIPSTSEDTSTQIQSSCSEPCLLSVTLKAGSVLDGDSRTTHSAERVLHNDHDGSDSACSEHGHMIMINQLKQKLAITQQDLCIKAEKYDKLNKIQRNADEEIHELTERLFTEAYKMAADAEKRRLVSVGELKDANQRLQMQQEQIMALKTLVHDKHTDTVLSPKSPFSVLRIGSPLRAPNDYRDKDRSSIRTALFGRKSSNPSGQSPSSSSASTSNQQTVMTSSANGCVTCDATDTQRRYVEQLNVNEVDSSVFVDFTQWRSLGSLDEDNAFMIRLFQEDIRPCFRFPNEQLSEEIMAAVQTNGVVIEPTRDTKPTVRQCALSEQPRICHYQLQVNEHSYYISDLARNRIAVVCDLFTYLRYLRDDIIKTGIHSAYWQLMHLRKDVHMARLGFGYLAAAESA